MIQKCEKRNGRVERFDKNRIQSAILKAFSASEEGNKVIAKQVTRLVLEKIGRKYKNEVPHVEDIQDTVEDLLMSLKFTRTARLYIKYRFEREQERV